MKFKISFEIDRTDENIDNEDYKIDLEKDLIEAINEVLEQTEHLENFKIKELV